MQRSPIQPPVKGKLTPHEIPLEDVNSISENFSSFCKTVLTHLASWSHLQMFVRWKRTKIIEVIRYLILIQRSLGKE